MGPSPTVDRLSNSPKKTSTLLPSSHLCLLNPFLPPVLTSKRAQTIGVDAANKLLEDSTNKPDDTICSDLIRKLMSLQYSVSPTIFPAKQIDLELSTGIATLMEKLQPASVVKLDGLGNPV